MINKNVFFIVFAEKEEEKRKITKNLEKMDEEIIAVEEYYNKKKKEVLMIIPEEEKEEDIEKIIEMEVKENKIMLDDQDQKTNFINNQGKMFFALEEQIEEKLKQKNSGKITNKEKLESQVKKHVTKELKKLDKAIIKQPAHKKIDKTLQQQNQSKENNRNKISRLTQRENQRKNTTIKNSLEESNQESEIRLRPNNLSSIEVLEEDLKREPAQVVKKNETRTKKSKKKTFKMHSWRLLRNWFNSKMQKQEKHAIMKKMKKQEKKVKKIITDSMARHGGKLNVVDRRCAWKIIEKNSYYFKRLLDISNDETEILPLAQSILIFLREANCKNLSSFVRENGTRLTTLQEEDIEFERRLHERLFPQPQIEPESEEHYVLDFPEIPSNLSNDEVSLNTSLADDNLSLEEPPEPPLQEFRESILASSKGNKARRHYLSHLIESDNNEVFSREDIEYLERKLDNASEPLIRDYLTLNDIGEVIGRETTDPCAGSSRSSSDRASNSTLQDPLNSKLRKIPGLDEPLISLPQKQSSKNFQIHSSPETNLNQTIANLVSEQKLKILRAHRGSSLAAVEEHKEKNRAKKENIDEVIRQNHEVATMLWRQREFKKNQEQEIFRSQQNMMQEQSIYYKNQERNRNFQLQQERTFYAHQKDHEARIKSRHSNLQVQENARIQNQRKENNVKIRKISSFDSPIETEKKKKANIEFIRSQAIEEMGKFDEAIGEQLKKQEQEHQREMEMKNAQIMRWKNKARAEQALKNFAQIDYHMVTGKELAQYNSSPVSSAAVSRTNSNASSIAAGSRSSIQSTSSMKSYKNVAKSSSRKNKDRIALPS